MTEALYIVGGLGFLIGLATSLVVAWAHKKRKRQYREAYKEFLEHKQRVQQRIDDAHEHLEHG